jgi:hypothetical protein
MSNHKWGICAGNKLNINLSLEAWKTIDSDRVNFSNSCEEISLSGFINQIFANYANSAKASYFITLSNYETDLKDELSKPGSGITDETLRKNLISYLRYKRSTEIKLDVEKYPIRGEARKFRVSNNNLDFILSSPEEHNYKNIASYVKAVLEEYARKSYSDREMIFFHDEFQQIKEAFDKGCEIRTIASTGQTRYLIPYSIELDTAGTFHYIVGVQVIVIPGQETIRKLRSFRISRLKIKAMTSMALKISQAEKDEIRDGLIRRGAQFFNSESINVKVKFTEKGLQTLQTLIRDRPKLVEKESNNVFVFDTTASQAEFYFIRFAEDAEVLEPSFVRRDMAIHFSSANNVYNAAGSGEINNSASEAE